MRRILVAFVAVVASAFVAHASRAGDPPVKPVAVVRLMNDHCPVTGEEVNPEVSYAWSGLEIRFCCEGCIPGFVKDPVKYLPTLLKDLMAQRDAARKQCADAAKAPAAAVPAPMPPLMPPPMPAPARVEPTAPAPPGLVDLGNAMCPVTTRPVKEGIFVEYHGMKVRLCCKGCAGGFRADPAKSLTWLRQDPAVARRIDSAEAAWVARPAPAPSPVK